MPRARRPIAALALAALMAATLAGCGAPPTLTTVAEARQERAESLKPALTAPAIKRDGELRIGIIESQGAPEVMEVDGSYQGIDVDAGAALAQKLGLKAVFVPIESAKKAADADVDVVMGVDKNDAGDLTVVSSYLEGAVSVFAKGEAPDHALSTQDFGGKTVGVQEGSASADLLSRSDLLVTQKTYGTLNEVFEALRDGAVDYAVAPAYPGGYLAHRLGDISLVGVLETPKAVGAGVASGNAELQSAVQEALDGLANGGVLSLGRSRWVGPMAVPSTELMVQGVTFSDKPASAAAVVTDTGTGNGADPNGVSVPSTGPMDGSTAGSNAVTSIG